MTSAATTGQKLAGVTITFMLIFFTKETGTEHDKYLFRKKNTLSTSLL